MKSHNTEYILYIGKKKVGVLLSKSSGLCDDIVYIAYFNSNIVNFSTEVIPTLVKMHIFCMCVCLGMGGVSGARGCPYTCTVLLSFQSKSSKNWRNFKNGILTPTVAQNGSHL